jgi:hypothetical protein
MFVGLSLALPKTLRAAWPYLLLLAAVMLFHRAALFSPGEYGVPWDLAGFHLPHAVYFSESLHRGEIPWWEPYAYCGRPFAANMQTEVFYPFRALTALVGTPRNTARMYYLFELEEFLHVFLAAALAYWMALRFGLNRPAALLTGLVYSLGSFFASQAEHIGELETAAWLPLAWGALYGLRRHCVRRDFLALAAALALAVLAGCAPLTLTVFLAVFALALGLVLTGAARPALLATALAAMALAACLCAFVLIPATQFSLASVARYRAEWRGTGGGVPLPALWSLIRPNYFGIFNLAGFKAPYEITLLYLYCGILPLPLALAAVALRRSRVKAAIAISLAVAGVWMLGDSTPIGVGLYKMLPGIIRAAFYAQFWMPAFALAVALLAGFGLAQHIRSAKLAYLVVAICAADLILVGSGRPLSVQPLRDNLAATDDTFEGRADTLETLRELAYTAVPPFRIDTIDDSINWAVRAAITRLPIATGYDPQALIRFTQARLAVADGQRWGAYYQAQHPDSPMLAAMNVKYLLSRKPLSPPPNLRLERELPGRLAYRNLAVLPRFYLVPRIVCASGMEEAARLVRRPGWDPAAEAVVECGAAGRMRDFSAPVSAISNVQYAGNAASLDIAVPGDAFLATAETHYPGWKAYIDGKEAPIYYTNVAFRGVFVPAGRHRVEMRYSPAAFGASAFVSLAAALLLFFAARRMKPAAPPVG